MKWKLLPLILLFSVLAAAQTITTSYRFTASAPDVGTLANGGAANETNSGTQFRKITWTVTGTLATCSVRVDSSADNVTYTAGGAITAQACTSNGASTVATGVFNYTRINVTAASGGGSVKVVYQGFPTSPGGGGSGTVTSVLGTTNQINSDGNTVTPTLSIPSTFIAPGTLTVDNGNGISKNFIESYRNTIFLSFDTNFPTTEQWYSSKRSRGTLALPTQVLAGDKVGEVNAFGYSSESAYVNMGGVIKMFAAENIAAGHHGSYVTINPVNVTSERNPFLVGSDGGVWMGTTAPSAAGLPTGSLYAGFDINGRLVSTVATGSAPFSITSTTVVPNLNVSQLLGSTWAVPGTIGSTTPSTGVFTTLNASGQITSTLATGTSPFVVASTTNVPNLNASSLGGATFAAPGAIGGTTPGSGAFTTLSATGQITSTVSTGTAPLVIASTTNVPNLNASSLNGATFAAPGAIGGGTPSTGAFTTLSATGQITSTLATGTAPFSIASTTVVPNLNVSQLLGGTWAIPGTIGSTTPNSGAFTTGSFTGLVTKYNNVTTVANGLTSEIATVDLTGQTAAIGTTNLIASLPSSAFYRACVYYKITTAASVSSSLGGTTGVSIGYTDGVDSVVQTSVIATQGAAGTIIANSTGNTTNIKLMGCMPLYGKTGTAVTYAVDYTSAGGTAMAYEFHLRLEAL